MNARRAKSLLEHAEWQESWRSESGDEPATLRQHYFLSVHCGIELPPDSTKAEASDIIHRANLAREVASLEIHVPLGATDLTVRRLVERERGELDYGTTFSACFDLVAKAPAVLLVFRDQDYFLVELARIEDVFSDVTASGSQPLISLEVLRPTRRQEDGSIVLIVSKQRLLNLRNLRWYKAVDARILNLSRSHDYYSKCMQQLQAAAEKAMQAAKDLRAKRDELTHELQVIFLPYSAPEITQTLTECHQGLVAVKSDSISETRPQDARATKAQRHGCLALLVLGFTVVVLSACQLLTK